LDCAFPLLNEITTGSADALWKNAHYIFLVGAKPRGKGMERGDLLRDNGIIFQKQGQLINSHANSGVLTLVVGNPANTNAMIAANNAPKIDKMQFSAMTRLDHDRALAQLADKLNVSVGQLSNVTIWGNHSATQVPDVTHAKVWYENGTTKQVSELVDAKWLDDPFTPAVQQRGAAIINARGSSSALSAASSSIDHIRDWENGTNGEWTSMAVFSDGSYGATKGLYFSFPVVCEGGDYSIVQNVPIDPFSAERIEKSHQELISERDAIAEFLPKH
jgi:malate dehydrogenase